MYYFNFEFNSTQVDCGMQQCNMFLSKITGFYGQGLCLTIVCSKLSSDKSYCSPESSPEPSGVTWTHMEEPGPGPGGDSAAAGDELYGISFRNLPPSLTASF